MNFGHIRASYEEFTEKTLHKRLFNHATIEKILQDLPPAFTKECVGKSVEGRNINLVKWGKGRTKVLTWSQMHGNEPTGTLVLFDLFNWLLNTHFNLEATFLENQLTLYFVPFVNPDGAEQWTRRNIQQIDVNRDYLNALSPEARILKKIQQQLQPEFGFNLHDQNTLWSVNGSNLPATLSYLAPAIDAELSVSNARKKAMLVIADMFKAVDPFLPNQIGLFDEEFEPRAFGDNFQKNGTATVLIEAGGFKADFEKQEIRKFYFLSLLAGLQSIATQSYEKQTLANYKKIPSNGKKLLHIIAKKIQVNGMVCDLSLNYEEQFEKATNSLHKIWTVHDIGDLSTWNAYEILQDNQLKVNEWVVAEQLAHFDILKNETVLYSFKNGILVHSTP